MRDLGRLTLKLTVVTGLAAFLIQGQAHSEDNWPQFRGPAMNGAVADNPNLPERWSTTKNVERPRVGLHLPQGRTMRCCTKTAWGRCACRRRPSLEIG